MSEIIGKANERKRFNRLNGVSPASGRKFLKFYFAEFYNRMETDDVERVFNVFINKPKDEDVFNEMKDDIQYWVDYFGSNWIFTWVTE